MHFLFHVMIHLMQIHMEKWAFLFHVMLHLMQIHMEKWLFVSCDATFDAQKETKRPICHI